MTFNFAQLNRPVILIGGILLPLISVALIISSRRRCPPVMAALTKR